VAADVRHVQHRVFFSTDIWEAGCEFRETDAAAREQLVQFLLSHQESDATVADPGPNTSTPAKPRAA